MTINLHSVHEHDAREQAHADYVSAPNFSELDSKANSRGFRKATISEIHASANTASWAKDLYCWAGGLWVKKI